MKEKKERRELGTTTGSGVSFALPKYKLQKRKVRKREKGTPSDLLGHKRAFVLRPNEPSTGIPLTNSHSLTQHTSNSLLKKKRRGKGGGYWSWFNLFINSSIPLISLLFNQLSFHTRAQAFAQCMLRAGLCD
eukprot:TRINITY_DN32326_c0_g1_i1.p1 TRINITY_DN32326_c0_g1~~TRINITY_DN32326_c0_g1_i1.p1  ORF type:complete len:132 (-),score=10.30 TRINITY_DN32326_c0_g1_i1:115-510(-)